MKNLNIMKTNIDIPAFRKLLQLAGILKCFKIKMGKG